ncbi:unnamed protein product [Ectocarpus sp. CCAP 1310/34]|nr:unnamed protein product [Ectocarpus sp. CCAP 1310/34]
MTSFSTPVRVNSFAYRRLCFVMAYSSERASRKR